jgi:hypothetical protein
MTALRWIVLGLVAASIAGRAVVAQEPQRPAKVVPPGVARVPKVANAKAQAPTFTAEREAAALTFVQRHHPELATLLERLKPMNRAEYEQAIGELFQVSESLANLKERDARRYELALDAWKARSRVELLTAELASAPGPELESQLRQALDDQVNVELRQQQFDREALEARLRKVNESIDRIEQNHDKIVESRFRALLKKSQRARQRDTAKPDPAKPTPTRAKGESKA